MLKSSVIIGTIIATLLTSGIAATDPAMAGDRNCNVYPDDELCNGTEGAQGMVFCDLHGLDRGDDCYDRDFSTIDCDEYPNHSRCGGTQGRDGLMFCDIQQRDMGFKENCYDRNDNPKEYCDKYAVEEADPRYSEWFCEAVCENYEGVIGRDDPCD